MEPSTPMTDIYSVVTALIRQLTSWATSLTTWILGDDLAQLFLGIMLLMLTIHIIHSLVHKFS